MYLTIILVIVEALPTRSFQESAPKIQTTNNRDLIIATPTTRTPNLRKQRTMCYNAFLDGTPASKGRRVEAHVQAHDDIHRCEVLLCSQLSALQLLGLVPGIGQFGAYAYMQMSMCLCMCIYIYTTTYTYIHTYTHIRKH